MSNVDADPSVTPDTGGGGDPSAGGPGGQQPAGAGGGGPILAALARRQQTPPVSAPGMGNMAQGLMQVKTAVDMLQSALPNLASGSQQHRDVIRAISQLARHLPQGAPTAGVQQTQLQDMLRATVRNALMQKLMTQRGGGGGAPAETPQAPAPSTPLPGA